LCARVRRRESAEALLDHRRALPNPQQHVHYLQEYVEGAERDIRVIVVGQRVLGAMQRRGRDWRCNGARGAHGVALQPSKELRLLARAVGGDVVGVDLITDRDGAHHVLEVNHGVEFREFEAVTGVDVAGAIVDHAVAAAATTVEAAA
jgi:[lysine-biosynthesis-protein LysW]--L-2-aminoadipate ligase